MKKKKKINPNELYVNIKMLSEIMAGERSDTLSQENGTGSLCISVILCMPTEKNCNPTVSDGPICQEITRQENCRETIDNCVSSACFTPSVEYCLVTTHFCEVGPIEPMK